MKLPILFLTLFVNSNILLGQTDSGKIQYSSFNIEVGHSTSIFLNSMPTFSFESNKPYYQPTFFKLTFNINPKYFISIAYKYYSAFEIGNNWVIGDIWLRKYNAFDIGVGTTYSVFKSKLNLQPCLMISTRPNGTENVYITSISGSFPKEPIFHNYSYRSLGLGAGFNIKYSFLKHLTVGLEMQYNYYFEKKHIRGKPIAGYQEFEKGYKINRQMLTPILKLGYQFNFKTKKPSP